MLSKKLPKINFIGNKEKIAEWICNFFPKKDLRVFDAFSGGASVSFEAKKRGYKEIVKRDVVRKIHFKRLTDLIKIVLSKELFKGLHAFFGKMRDH